MLAMLLGLLAAAPLQTTWTVDDDGPADFPSIQLAIDAASNGDLVLIQPGSYEHFHLAKDLRLIGATGGSPCLVDSTSIVSNVGDFALVGLHFDQLVVVDVLGEGLMDDCKVGPFVSMFSAPPALVVSSTSQLTVQRTDVAGGVSFNGFSDQAGMGAKVEDSGVVFVGCTIRGKDGDCGLDGNSDGAVGLLVRLGSEVLLASTSITGGNCDSPGIPVCSGIPADAVDVKDSTLVVRGDAGDKLSAGYNETVPVLHAKAIGAIGSNVVWSGVTIAVGGAAGVQPAQPEPFADVQGGSAPGDAASIGISGPPGTVGWLLLSGAGGDVSLPAWEANLWLNPTQVFLSLPVVTTGQSTPVLLTGTLPTDPLLVGVIVRGQVAFPGVASTAEPGTKLMGNPFAIPLRF